MFRYRAAFVSLAFVLALLVGSSLEGQEKKEKDKDKTPPVTGKAPPLPTHYNKLGLSKDQKEKILAIRKEANDKADELEKQAKDIRTKGKKDYEEVLTKEQKDNLRKIISESAPAPDK